MLICKNAYISDSGCDCVWLDLIGQKLQYLKIPGKLESFEKKIFSLLRILLKANITKDKIHIELLRNDAIVAKSDRKNRYITQFAHLQNKLER